MGPGGDSFKSLTVQDWMMIDTYTPQDPMGIKHIWVSTNRGTQKWMVYSGKSFENCKNR